MEKNNKNEYVDSCIWIGRKSKNGRILPTESNGEWEGFRPTDIDEEIRNRRLDNPNINFIKCKCIYVEINE